MGTIDRSFRGDIETIIAKMLAKDPARRYQSVAEVDADIERHLQDVPISARPATIFYRMRRFTKRNRRFIATSAIVVGLIGTVVGVSWAVSANRGKQELYNDAGISSRAGEHFNRVFGALLESLGHEQRRAVKPRLLEAEGSGQKQLCDDPEALVEFYNRMGRIYWFYFLDFDLAAQRYSSALELGERLYGKRGERTLRFANVLGDVLRDAGEFTRAEKLARTWREFSEGQYGRDNETTTRFATNLADALAGNGEWNEAEELYRETLTIQKRILPHTHPDIPETMNSLASVLLAVGKYAEAWQLAEDTVKQQRLNAVRRRRVQSLDDNTGELRALTTRGS
ncbi:MAG: tetratricopeptide repeat protein, partial [Chloroflexi bacterium]|nr:tetratricopeptide repeat protein [Chloroflexota bacterium]